MWQHQYHMWTVLWQCIIIYVLQSSENCRNSKLLLLSSWHVRETQRSPHDLLSFDSSILPILTLAF